MISSYGNRTLISACAAVLSEELQKLLPKIKISAATAKFISELNRADEARRSQGHVPAPRPRRDLTVHRGCAQTATSSIAPAWERLFHTVRARGPGLARAHCGWAETWAGALGGGAAPAAAGSPGRLLRRARALCSALVIDNLRSYAQWEF